MKKYVTLAILTCLLSLMGCSRTPKETIKIVHVSPPETLLEEHDVPRWQGGNVKQLADYTGSLRDSLDQCNADKRLLKKWDETMKEGWSDNE